MAQKQTFSEDVQGMWQLLTLKEKLLFIVQSVLGVAILFILLLGYAGVLHNTLVNRIDLILLTVLLIVSALRTFPKHKMRIAAYIACAVIAIIFLVTTFL